MSWCPDTPWHTLHHCSKLSSTIGSQQKQKPECQVNYYCCFYAKLQSAHASSCCTITNTHRWNRAAIKWVNGGVKHTHCDDLPALHHWISNGESCMENVGVCCCGIACWRLSACQSLFIFTKPFVLKHIEIYWAFHNPANSIVIWHWAVFLHGEKKPQVTTMASTSRSHSDTHIIAHTHTDTHTPLHMHFLLVLLSMHFSFQWASCIWNQRQWRCAAVWLHRKWGGNEKS